jgi:hypothetical protein
VGYHKEHPNGSGGSPSSLNLNLLHKVRAQSTRRCHRPILQRWATIFSSWKQWQRRCIGHRWNHEWLRWRLQNSIYDLVFLSWCFLTQEFMKPILIYTEAREIIWEMYGQGARYPPHHGRAH